MLLNNLRIAWRSLQKNKMFSIVNILGLSVGISAFMLITTYVRFEKSYESFNPNSDNVLRVTFDLYNGSEYIVTDCETHPGIGPEMKEKIPQVIDYLRMFSADGLVDFVVRNQKFLEDQVYYADPSFFNILGAPLLTGDPSKVLSDPFQAVITTSVAKKFFGTTDVVGESFRVSSVDYKISGVVADAPPNTHIKYKVLLSHATLPKTRNWYSETDWGSNNEFTYVLVEPGTDVKMINEALQQISKSHAEPLNQGKFNAEPLSSIHLHSNKTFEPEVNGSHKVVSFLMVIALFVIIIAWVNYMNLATARSVERAKEVGIRKVMGSLSAQLIVQFLMESFVINLIATIIGFGLFQIASPFFRILTGVSTQLGMQDGAYFFLLFGVLTVSGSLLAGIYPAFVLSSFKPATVLKGKFRSSMHGQWLRKSLVVFQFSATVVLIIGVCTVFFQLRHLRSVDLGLDMTQTLAVRVPARETLDSSYFASYDGFRNELLGSSLATAVSRSGSLPGVALAELNTSTLSRVGHEAESGKYEYYWFGIDREFVNTMHMELVAGSNFSESGSNAGKVLVNEEAVKRLGFSDADEAIGTEITLYDWRTKKPSSVIVGVLKNFYQRSPKEEHIPMVFQYSEAASYVAISLNAENMIDAVDRVEKAWRAHFPGEVFHYFFADDNFNAQYTADKRFGNVMATFSGLAILIACLGLFGLSSYTIVQRTKEIGIRKVLGASVSQIVSLLSMEYIKVVTISSIVALPLAFWACTEWLSTYTTRISLNAWIFLFPVGLILMIALLTVSFQTIQSAIANPANSLKEE